MLLNDLHIIAQHAWHIPLWDCLIKYTTLNELSDDAKQRLERIVPVLAHCLANQGRLQASAWIEGTWLALGGPASLNNQKQLENTKIYFKLLEQLEQEHG